MYDDLLEKIQAKEVFIPRLAYCDLHKVHYNPKTNPKCAICQLLPSEQEDVLKKMERAERAEKNRKACKDRYYVKVMENREEYNKRRRERRKSIRGTI